MLRKIIQGAIVWLVGTSIGRGILGFLAIKQIFPDKWVATVFDVATSPANLQWILWSLAGFVGLALLVFWELVQPLAWLRTRSAFDDIGPEVEIRTLSPYFVPLNYPKTIGLVVGLANASITNLSQSKDVVLELNINALREGKVISGAPAGNNLGPSPTLPNVNGVNYIQSPVRLAPGESVDGTIAFMIVSPLIDHISEGPNLVWSLLIRDRISGRSMEFDVSSGVNQRGQIGETGVSR